MGILTKSLISLVQKSAPVSYGSRMSFGSALTGKQSREGYLRYYNEIGWLRAAISAIAQGVSQSEWRLYKKVKGEEREEITEEHEIKDILNRPNPFQSGHDLLEQHQIFDELVGEIYWVKQNDRGTKELWLISPQ